MKRFYPAMLGIVICIGTAAITLYVWHFWYGNSVMRDVKDYTQETHTIERAVVEKVPIYEDFATPEMEQAMRRHLLQDHLDEARKTGRKPVETEDEVRRMVADSTLAALDQTQETPYYFYNVPAPGRYLSPEARDCLLLVAARFQENLGKRTSVPVVKLAVSSALRTTSYQKQLREKNANASYASSHSYGISFDIFYDDFFVALPLPSGRGWLSTRILADLRPRLGYLMGDALARQFRSVLLETLLQLQNEGALYAILEKNQRCYHVTVRRGR